MALNVFDVMHNKNTMLPFDVCFYFVVIFFFFCSLYSPLRAYFDGHVEIHAAAF